MFGREEQAIVLDVLPYGKSGEAKREPLVQLLGVESFTLLEAVPKEGASFNVGERVHVGKGDRKKIERIRGRIKHGDLTNSAKTEVHRFILEVVKEKEERVINFLNHAGPISLRSHTLEHLPGVGKKHLTAILDAREKKPFESFKDFNERVPHLGNVTEIIEERIVHELLGTAKYYLFTKPMRVERY